MNQHENKDGEKHQNSGPRNNKEQALDLFEIRTTETKIKKLDLAVGEANHALKEAKQDLSNIDQSINATKDHLFDEQSIGFDHERLAELFRGTGANDIQSILEAACKYAEIAGPYLNRIAYLNDLRKQKIRAKSDLYEATLKRDNLLSERGSLEVELDELENAYFDKYKETPNGGLVFINSSILRQMMRFSAN